MNELLSRTAIFLAIGILMLLLWRRIFRGTGKMVLLIAWLILAILSTFSFQAVQILFWGCLVFVLVYESWRVIRFPRYKKANAVFETNQILRGLSPIETALFIGLDKSEVFIVALLNLTDKGILTIGREVDSLIVSVADEYRLGHASISADERASVRRRIARDNDQVIQPFEDVFIELISSHDGGLVSEINFDIWYQYLDNHFNNLDPVYDFHQTSDYARKIVEKMAAPDSAYSAGKRNLSAWKAIWLFDRGQEDLKDHRPGWLAPDDAFTTLVFELRELL
jgi:hypothetical protein